MEEKRLEKMKISETALALSILKKQNLMLGDSLLQLDNLLYLHKSISLLDYNEIKNLLAEKLPYILSIRFFTLFLYDKVRKSLKLNCHNHPDLKDDLVIRLDESGIMRDALINGRYILETDYFRSKYFVGKKNALYQNAFFVCIPLMIENEIIGVLNLNDNAKGFFTVGDLDFVLNVTEFLSLSISNALLFEKVETLSVTDGLTGLNNHQQMLHLLNAEFVRSSRYGSPLSLAMMDVDHFKKVNDTYGHQKGDEILIQAAAVLKKAYTPNDIAARYGGEEFVLVLPETKLQGALQIAERVRQEFSSCRFQHNGKEFAVTLSAGVAEFDRQRMDRPTQLMKVADQALYKAKETGRNKTVLGTLDGDPTT